ncbi:hypothetical protein DSO57_1038778 [Entomophthora muscae]|uniref:Uncharacterized protein n=1 Tax=Entomophthora muscae TaxID=34485 RepID=A0ACC2SYN5_9FUNG|nr:hypothetical protein DSO57_1038778 [Entomophthora muscae]
MATLKLGALLIRTLAKPVANSLKSQTKNSDLFRKFCIGLAQKSHRYEMKMKMNFLGYEKERIRPLSESRAVELGANFLGESLIFMVAAGVIGFEAYRSNTKAKDRVDYVNEAIEDFRNLSIAYQDERQKNVELLAQLQKKIDDLVNVSEASTELLQTVVSHMEFKSDGEGAGGNATLRVSSERDLETLKEEVDHAKSLLLKINASRPEAEPQSPKST